MKNKNDKNCWDNNAKNYDKVMKKDAKAYERIIQITNKNIKDLDVLEVGCGSGIISINCAEPANSYLATDYSEEMIKVAKSKAENKDIVFEIADATNLQYNDNSFDAVIISNCLHIMPEPTKALAEIKRVLKDGGIFLAPNFCHRGTFISIFLPVLKLFLDFICYNAWRYDDYMAFLEENGFTIIEYEKLKASCPMLMVVCKNN